MALGRKQLEELVKIIATSGMNDAQELALWRFASDNCPSFNDSRWQEALERERTGMTKSSSNAASPRRLPEGLLKPALDCDVPEAVPVALRHTADAYRQSTMELQSAWQDDNAGKIWSRIATVLDRAAKSIDLLLAKYPV